MREEPLLEACHLCATFDPAAQAHLDGSISCGDNTFTFMNFIHMRLTSPSHGETPRTRRLGTPLLATPASTFYPHSFDQI